jgi:hypothetical protein
MSLYPTDQILDDYLKFMGLETASEITLNKLKIAFGLSPNAIFPKFPTIAHQFPLFDKNECE